MGTTDSEATLFVIGVDGGGSKTAAAILDHNGQLLGRGWSGPSNIHSVGLDQARDNLVAAMQEAAQEAELAVAEAAAVAWALAGAGRPAERRLLADLGAAMLPGIPLRIENDAVAALMGGLGSHQGVVLIAGTGMIAYGENKQGQPARAGGWGPFLDRGSAYDLAQEAMRAVCQAEDGSAFPTRLTGCLLQALALEQVSDILSWVYAPERPVADIARLAPLVLAEAEAGDLAAMAIVSRGAAALAGAVDAVARRLALWDRPFPLILAGSLLENPFYRQVVNQAVRTQVPHAVPLCSRADAAVGAGLLALETLGRTLPAPAEALETATDSAWPSEQVNVLTRDLDLYPTETMIGLMHLQDQQAVAAVRPALPAITRAADDIASRMGQGGRLIYVGAGTSGRLGVLDASECPPTFNADSDQVVGVIAGGVAAMTSAVEGVEDDAEAGARALRDLAIGPLDSIVGITASGRTPYVQGALAEAGRRQALTIALTCNLPAPVAEAAQHVIAPLVGPEALAGSTRLKAGTAQKLILNMLSTAVMVRLGKTYGNLMVDLRPENVKLQARTRRIVAQACGLSEEEAANALRHSGGEVKVAIVTTLAGCSQAEARQRLVQAGGVVRKALTINS
jgi:N-acetylmuramic acid 6-phosphate etherase